MMWRSTLIFVTYVVLQVESNEIKVNCYEVQAFPPIRKITPSLLADLKVELVTVRQRCAINISWAINIDGSTKSLTGTRIEINGDSTYHCKYNPPFDKADISGSDKKWFHHVASASYGITLIQASNLPQPEAGSGSTYKLTEINIPHPKSCATPATATTPREYFTPVQDTTTVTTTEAVALKIVFHNFTSVAVTIFGVLGGLMILSLCYTIYQICGARFATLGFKRLPTSPMVPLPVLLVYPAENSAFQRAVVALAEFLQSHGGCNVAVDMWQQGKIAELGPMRWLAEQAKAADRVLIICPQAERPSCPLSSPPIHSFLPEPSIPAAAHDLYPLILNMVASHAKSTSDLAKFWAVQLGEQQAKSSSNLPPELRACKTFRLMKDLKKLHRSLHTQRQDNKKISNLVLKPEIDKNSVKLREAVEKLGGHPTSIFRELEPLKSVVSTM